MKDLFEVQRRCLRIMGHNFDRNGGPQRPWLQNLRKLWYITCLIIVISAQAPMINYIVYNISDLALASGCLSILFTNMLTVIKISTFLNFKGQFEGMINQLQKMLGELNDPLARKPIELANKTAIRLVKAYYYCSSCTGLYFMVGPVFKTLWALLRHQDIVKELPMPMRFPFDYESSPGYELCFFYTGFVTLSVIMYASSVDGLFLSFTLNLRAHYQALQYYITSNSYSGSPDKMQRDISGFVQYHLLLLDLSDRVGKIYKPILFGQFLMTSLQVGVIVYQLVSFLDSIFVVITNCSFFASIMLQLFIYCYGGELLKLESSMVGTAIQLTPWYKLKPSQRRMLQLILLRSQRAAVIKSGFYEASLANFMAILKAAMSYITLMQSIE